MFQSNLLKSETAETGTDFNTFATERKTESEIIYWLKKLTILSVPSVDDNRKKS